MDAALLAILTETVQLSAYTGQDGYGMPTYAVAIEVPARIEYKVRRMVNAQGQEMLSRAKVFLDSTVTLTLKDRLTLPDGTSPAMQLLYSPRDEAGALAHHEVFF